jgi:hypothetical protein
VLVHQAGIAARGVQSGAFLILKANATQLAKKGDDLACRHVGQAKPEALAQSLDPHRCRLVADEAAQPAQGLAKHPVGCPDVHDLSAPEEHQQLRVALRRSVQELVAQAGFAHPREGHHAHRARY